VSAPIWIESLAQDLRHSARTLAASPGFTAVAILSLALGTGANTAIFQLLDAVRLRNLPVRNPQELVEVKIVGGNHGMGLNESYGELTRPIWEEIRRSHEPLTGVFAWGIDQMSVGQGSDFHRVRGMIISGDFFPVLGVEPFRGRLMVSKDEHACPESVAVVSYSYWLSRMGGGEILPGTRLFVNREFKQIVGVTPPSFHGLAVGEDFDVAVPYCQPKELQRNLFEVTVMGRLRPGVTLKSASDRLAGISPGIMAATEIKGYDPGTVERYLKFRLAVYPASAGVSELRKAYNSSLWLLLAMTGLVLLIACANLANLMLARAATREREIAIRLALGAARLHLFRQLLVESGLTAVLGAGLGIGLAQLLSRALVLSLSTESDAVTLPIETDWRVLLFAITVATITCILFGLVPAIRASGTDPAAAMKNGGRASAGTRESFSVQRLMVVAQISVSLVLLVGAMLFVRSFRNLMTFNPGMREEAISVVSVGFGESGFGKATPPRARYPEITRELADEVSRIPGVLHAATTTHVPLVGGSWSLGVTVGSVKASSMYTGVSPTYFETMGIPLLSGRGFNQNDTATSPRVAVVNQTFVRRYLNGADPLGKTMLTHAEPDYPASVYEIVGVIPDIRYDSLRAETPPMTFAPAAQFPSPEPWTAVMIHSNLPPETVIGSVKRMVASSHPEMILQGRSFQGQIRDGLVRERLLAMLSGFFGLIAAILAMAGLYGVISYLITRRRGEIGIRVALGANRSQVIGMVMREAGLLLLIGIVLGTALALAAGRGAGSLLFGLQAHDPLTLAAGAGLLAAIGALAAFLPARRASKLDPMAALRCD
jgi:predicted permease